jgi:hypothetical protein
MAVGRLGISVTTTYRRDISYFPFLSHLQHHNASIQHVSGASTFITLDTSSPRTMGLFTASAPTQLHPVNPPLGVFPQFCVNVPTTLVLKEKAFTFSGVSGAYPRVSRGPTGSRSTLMAPAG